MGWPGNVGRAGAKVKPLMSMLTGTRTNSNVLRPPVRSQAGARRTIADQLGALKKSGSNAALAPPPSMRTNGPAAGDKPKSPEPRQNAGPNPNEPDARLWARARRENTPVKLRLLCGDVIEGTVSSYGLYSVEITTTDGGATVVWKHALAMAATAAITTMAKADTVPTAPTTGARP
jgi:sRNA-binding regulator protein Hfq